MKKLIEMKIAKEAILSSVEADAKGGNVWGASTSYQGPASPTSLTTYVDGFNMGADPYSGRAWGDWWNIDSSMQNVEAGILFIKQ